MVGAATGLLAEERLQPGAAMIGGAITGAIATGTWKGAIMGAFTGAVTAGIGWAANTYEWTNITRIAAQPVSGGVMELLQGGNFGNGFFAAGLTAAVMPNLRDIENDFARVAAGALVGGTISNATGGKFANGAISGAIQAAMIGSRRPGQKSSNESGKIELDPEIARRSASEGQATLDARVSPRGYSSPDEVATLLDDVLPSVAKRWNTELGARIFEEGGRYYPGMVVSDGSICGSGNLCTVNVNLSHLNGEYGRGFLYGDYHTHPASSAPGFSWSDIISSPRPAPSGYISYLSQYASGQRLIALDHDQYRGWSDERIYRQAEYRVVRGEK